MWQFIPWVARRTRARQLAAELAAHRDRLEHNDAIRRILIQAHQL